MLANCYPTNHKLEIYNSGGILHQSPTLLSWTLKQSNKICCCDSSSLQIWHYSTLFSCHITTPRQSTCHQKFSERDQPPPPLISHLLGYPFVLNFLSSAGYPSQVFVFFFSLHIQYKITHQIKNHFTWPTTPINSVTKSPRILFYYAPHFFFHKERSPTKQALKQKSLINN